MTDSLSNYFISNVTYCLRCIFHTILKLIATLDWRGSTFLHLAIVWGGSKRLLTVLIWAYDEDHALTIQDQTYGLTPIHLALRFKSEDSEIMEFLMSSKSFKSALSVASTIGTLPIHIACEYAASTHIISSIIQHYPEGALFVTQSGDTALHLACKQDFSIVNASFCHIRVIRLLLLANETAVHTMNNMANTVIHILNHKWKAYLESAEGASTIESVKSISCILSAGEYSTLYRLWFSMYMVLYTSYFTTKDPHFWLEMDTFRSDHKAYDFLLLAAIKKNCPFSLIEFIIRLFPNQLLREDKNSRTVLAVVVSSAPNETNDLYQLIDLLLDNFPEASRIYDKQGRFPLHLAIINRNCWHTIESLIRAAPEILGVKDPLTLLYPFAMMSDPYDILAFPEQRRALLIKQHSTQNSFPIRTLFDHYESGGSNLFLDILMGNPDSWPYRTWEDEFSIDYNRNEKEFSETNDTGHSIFSVEKENLTLLRDDRINTLNTSYLLLRNDPSLIS